jgi:hypothetical protein
MCSKYISPTLPVCIVDRHRNEQNSQAPGTTITTNKEQHEHTKTTFDNPSKDPPKQTYATGKHNANALIPSSTFQHLKYYVPTTDL